VVGVGNSSGGVRAHEDEGAGDLVCKVSKGEEDRVQFFPVGRAVVGGGVPGDLKVGAVKVGAATYGGSIGPHFEEDRGPQDASEAKGVEESVMPEEGAALMVDEGARRASLDGP